MSTGETFRPTRKEPDPKNQPPATHPIIAKALQKNMEKMAAEGEMEQPLFPPQNFAAPQQTFPTQQPFAQNFTPQQPFPTPQFAPTQYVQQENSTRAEPISGPRLAFGVNEDYNSLVAGIKELDIYAYREVQLPSLGRFYDGSECPTNGLVHVRPMAGTEEEILSTPALFRNGQAINKIFRACVQEPINPERMLTIDRTALLVYIRAISYGADYEVEVRCQVCQNKFPYNINLNRDLDACPDDLTKDKLVEKLPTTGYLFTYRLPTGADDILVSKYSEKKSKVAGNAPDDTFQYKASILISSIEDPKSKVKVTDQNSIRMLIQRLPINDITYIRNVINDPPFGMNTKCDVECPACNERFEIEMPVEINFFFPNLRKKKTH